MTKSESTVQEPQDESQALPEVGLVQAYYDHQFTRLGQLEEHGLAVSGFIGAITVGAFALGPDSPLGTASFEFWVLRVTLVVLNALGAIYVFRVMAGQDVHEYKAKAIVARFAPEVAQIDKRFRHRFFPKTRVRGWLQIAMHVSLLVAGLLLTLR